MTGDAPPRGDAVGVESTESAPAKVNLYLHVTGRRPDGYHLLDSLIVFADLCDTVTAAPAERLSLTLAGPFADALDGADNLVSRAARALAAHAGRPPRATLRLVKHVPVAAGLGGGSSDAAAALRALIRLWGLSIEADELARLALELGADVPVCLAGHACFVGGIGDALTPAPALPSAPILLVNPGVAVPTTEVFAARTGEFADTNGLVGLALTVTDTSVLLIGTGTSLTPPGPADNNEPLPTDPNRRSRPAGRRGALLPGRGPGLRKTNAARTT